MHSQEQHKVLGQGKSVGACWKNAANSIHCFYYSRITAITKSNILLRCRTLML